MRELNRKVGEMEYDGLITDLNPPVQTRGAVIAKVSEAAAYPRGTIFAKSSSNNMLYLLGSTGVGTLTPDCVLCDETKVGIEADVTAVVYTAGCFDPEKTTVKDGYAITEADRDKLRERNIVFKAAHDAN